MSESKVWRVMHPDGSRTVVGQTDAEIVAVMRDGYNCRYNDEQDHIDFARAVLAKWGTQPQAGAVPQGWKAVPVNPTPEMWKAAKTVPDPNPPYPPHYGLVWDAMLAASPTPPAEQQAAPKAAPGEQACQGARCAATAANGLHHSRECLIEAGQAQGWVPTTTELANAGPSAPAQPAVAAPQQEAQEPAFWMNEKGHTWSHSDWKQFPKHRAKYPIPLYPHFPTPQPAPDCHHRPPCDECAALAAQGGK